MSNSLSRRRTTGRAGARAAEAAIDAGLAEQEALRRAKREATLAIRRTEDARPSLTRDQIAGAALVRERHWGWHRVESVNVKTVTVGAGYRLPFTKIIDALEKP